MTPESAKRFGPVEIKLKNGDTATVRPLRLDDGEALASFYEGIPQEDVRFYCPHLLDREHALANAAKAESPLETVLVIEIADTIAGYAWYRWKEEAAEVSSFGICISRTLQGCGAGKGLMARLNEIAREIGPARMQLTVQKANERGVILYQKMGFSIVCEQMRESRQGFAPEPEYQMERQVRSTSQTEERQDKT